MTKTVRILAAAALALLASSVRAEDKMPSHMIDTIYHFGKPGPYASMNTHFIWIKGPADEHIYEGFDFHFTAYDKSTSTYRAQGYMGPQIYKKKKRVIFSIWNAVEGEKTAVAVSGHCSKFDGEGTGIHCEANYDWQFGRDYKLTVERSTVDAEGEVWVGSIEDAQKKAEIGTIRVKNVFGLKGYGGLADYAAAFTEYVGDRKRTCDTLPPIRVLWKGPFTEGTGAAATSKTIYPDACANSNVISVGRPALIHEAGAGVVRRNGSTIDVWNPATPLLH